MKTWTAATLVALLVGVATQAAADCSKEMNCLAVEMNAVQLKTDGAIVLYKHGRQNQDVARMFLDMNFEKCRVRQVRPWKRDEEGADFTPLFCQDKSILAVRLDGEFMALAEVK